MTKASGDAIRAEAAKLEASAAQLRKTATTVDTEVSAPSTTVPPPTSGFSVVSQWDFSSSTFPTGVKDDGLTFNYGTGQMLDAVNLMRNCVYNGTKKCWELWGKHEDYGNTGKSGYWATAHWTSCQIQMGAGTWKPGMRVEVVCRMTDVFRSCVWSQSGPDEFDFPEHFHSDTPKYNPAQSDHWNVITSYSPTVQNPKLAKWVDDGKPHLYWCDYLVDGANVVMGRDGTTFNTVAKSKLKDPTMSHGIRVGVQIGGTWDGGYDAVQKGYWPSIQIPTANACSDLYSVRLLKK